MQWNSFCFKQANNKSPVLKVEKSRFCFLGARSRNIRFNQDYEIADNSVMSSTARYTTFDLADRFSCPSEEVAQRLTSAWLLECCSSRCCYPWKRYPSRYTDDHFKCQVKDLKKNDKKLEGAKSFEHLSRDDKSDSEECPLNLISVRNYQGKKRISEQGKILSNEEFIHVNDYSNNDADDENNEDFLDKPSEKLSPQSRNDENGQLLEFRSFDDFNDNKPLSRKYSLDTGTKREDNKQSFRKYSLDTKKAERFLEAENKVIVDKYPLHSGDYIEPDGSSLFKKCLSFKNKKFQSKKQKIEDAEGAKSLDLLSEKEKMNADLEELEKKESENKKDKENLFASDYNSSSSSSSDSFCDFEIQKDVKELEGEINPRRIRRQCKSKVISILPKVRELRETEEEVDSLNGIDTNL